MHIVQMINSTAPRIIYYLQSRIALDIYPSALEVKALSARSDLQGL